MGKNKEIQIDLYNKFYDAIAGGTSATDLEKECIASIKEAAARVEADRKAHEREYHLAKAQEVKKDLTESLLKLLDLYEIFDFYCLERDSQDMLYTKAEELADAVGDLLIELGPRILDINFRALVTYAKYFSEVENKSKIR